MGYVREVPTYHVVFEPGHELAGFEMRVQSLATGQLMDLTAMASRLAGKVGPGSSMSEQDAADLATLFTSLAGALVEWNLEDCPHGKCPGPGRCTARHIPIAPDLAGVRKQDQGFSFQLVQQWMQAAGGVPDPLGGGSTPGATDGEQEMGIPMEPLAGLPS